MDTSGWAMTSWPISLFTVAQSWVVDEIEVL